MNLRFLSEKKYRSISFFFESIPKTLKKGKMLDSPFSISEYWRA